MLRLTGALALIAMGAAAQEAPDTSDILKLQECAGYSDPLVRRGCYDVEVFNRVGPVGECRLILADWDGGDGSLARDLFGEERAEAGVSLCRSHLALDAMDPD